MHVGPCCTLLLSAELESLLAAQRVREYSGELGLQQGAGQLGAIQQRNKALEQQVGLMCHHGQAVLVNCDRPM